MTDEKDIQKRGSSALVKYEDWTVDAADKEAAEVDAAASDFLKLKVGDNEVRFLPPPRGQQTPFTVVNEHFVNLPGMEKSLVFACPWKTDRRRCPFCEQANELSRTGNPADVEISKKLRPKLRIYASVIDMRAPDAGPRVLAFGKTIYDQLIDIRRDQKNGGNFTDPTDQGFNIVISRKGTTVNDTEYRVQAARSNSPLHDMTFIDAQIDLSPKKLAPDDEEMEEMVDTIRLTLGGGRRRAAAPPDRQVGDGTRTGRTSAAAPNAPNPPRGRTVQGDVDDDNVKY